MKTKKIIYYFLIGLFTPGASLILGFLSFGGMFALWPILSLALTSLVLSVAYDAEIYLQNIKNALNKLFFKRNYLDHYLGNEYLLAYFPNTNEEDCPEFFKDYEKQLQLLHVFDHKRLDKHSKAKKKRIQKSMRNMEKWFAQQLYDVQTTSFASKYEEELRNWLSLHQQNQWQNKLKLRRRVYRGAFLFSCLAGTFMGLFTTYLLVESFAAIPLLATIPFGSLPFFIVPMAILAGGAYALLTYNAITDMINHDTIRSWYRKIRDDLKNGIKFRSVFMAVITVLLVILAIVLTVFTAGTAWTIVKEARPLFSWLGQLPSFVMGIINPIITGLSTLVFTLENTNESLEIIDELKVKPNFFKRLVNKINKNYQELREEENWGQIFNIPRILIKITFAPLRMLLFLGHIISMAVQSDQVPGIPEIASAVPEGISEIFNDGHYFIGHSHGHHHAQEHHHEQEHEHHQDAQEPKHKHKHSSEEKSNQDCSVKAPPLHPLIIKRALRSKA